MYSKLLAYGVVGLTLLVVALPNAAQKPGNVEYICAGEWHDCPEYAFSYPGRVAVSPTGEVFVIDENIQRLTEWTWCGSYKRAWKHLDEVDIFSGFGFMPSDVAVGPEGDIYMAAFDEVRRYAADGAFVGAWRVAGGESDVNEYAWAITAGPGGDVYVLVSPPGCIRYYTPEGIYLGQWGSEGPGEGEFGGAFDVAVSPRTGHVYVADEGKACVQYFTAAGSFLGRWGTPGSATGQFGDSLSLAVGPDGTVFVADSGNNRVQYFTPTGSFLKFLGYAGPQFPYHRFEYPADVAVGADGTVYVADRGDNRVVYYRPRAAEK